MAIWKWKSKPPYHHTDKKPTAQTTPPTHHIHHQWFIPNFWVARRDEICHLRVVKWFPLSSRDSCSTIESSSLKTQLLKDLWGIFACSVRRSGKHVQGCQNFQFPRRKTRSPSHPSHSLEIMVLKSSFWGTGRTPGWGKMGASGGWQLQPHLIVGGGDRSVIIFSTWSFLPACHRVALTDISAPLEVRPAWGDPCGGGAGGSRHLLSWRDPGPAGRSSKAGPYLLLSQVNKLPNISSHGLRQGWPDFFFNYIFTRGRSGGLGGGGQQGSWGLSSGGELRGWTGLESTLLLLLEGLCTSVQLQPLPMPRAARSF